MLPFFQPAVASSPTGGRQNVKEGSACLSGCATEKHISPSESSSRDGRSVSAASKSHSEAERRRRERINNHLATLRSLLPNTRKTDKASLLAEVIAYVKELKRNAASVGLGSPCGLVPSEADEVSVDPDPFSPLIKASVCCDDRPDLLSDLTRTLRALRVRAVKAEISTLGGRVKNVFLIQPPDFSHPSLPSLRHALRAVTDKPAQGSVKRARLAQQLQLIHPSS